MLEGLDKYIEKNKDLAVKTLSELLQIKSEEAPAVTSGGEVYPFGRGVQDAFMYTLAKAEEFGFETCNVENYGGHIDFGAGKECVGIIGHLDVVPAGEGWDFNPYGGELINGYILGRGTTDDKGPLLASLFAMKSLKDAGYEPARKVRLIIGLDEETEWRGMDHYLRKVKKPDFGFTPDSQFPVINGEKGILHFDIAKKLSHNAPDGIVLKKLSGGAAANVVPENARAVVSSNNPEDYAEIKKLAEEYCERTSYKITTKRVGKSMEIVAFGKSAHASVPEEGLNAIAVLFDFFSELNFASDDFAEFVRFYNEKIGFTTDGSGLNVKFSDEKSGELTLSVGVINFDAKAISIVCDVRYPISANEELFYDRLRPIIDEFNLGIVKGESKEPIFFDTESNLIKTLVGVYAKNTGDTESKAIVTGGGTYARCCPNIVAFGGLFPGDPDIMHQRNEKLALERFYKMIEIYADAIVQLTQEDFSL